MKRNINFRDTRVQGGFDQRIARSQGIGEEFELLQELRKRKYNIYIYMGINIITLGYGFVIPLIMNIKWWHEINDINFYVSQIKNKY